MSTATVRMCFPSRLMVFLVLTGFPSWFGCSTDSARDKTTAPPGSRQSGQAHLGDPVPKELTVSPLSYDFSQNPGLLQRILAGPHGYFRFVDGVFSRTVCARFGRQLTQMPVVNLHGDAHLEQYAVTDNGRGLMDFDKSTQGMPFLDQVHFGVSLHLACRANDWTEEAGNVVDEFLRGYYSALENPQLSPPLPKLVVRIREQFGHDRNQVLERAESLMEPMDRSRHEVEQAMQQYFRDMRTEYPELQSLFFSVKKMGRLHLGIGSALDEKYLIRIEGATSSPEDDLIMEAKEVRELEDLNCIEQSGADAARILTGQARIAYSPQRYVGFFMMESHRPFSVPKTFWVFAWDDHYKELSIDSSFGSLDDLSSIAFDVGVQLGLGHPKGLQDYEDVPLRRRLLRVTKELEEDLHRIILDLTGQVIAAWLQFRSEAESVPGARRSRR